MSSSAEASTINHKDCIYGCTTRIYWNTLTSYYLEAVSKKKHVCPNRSTNNTSVSLIATQTNNNAITSKPAIYHNNNYKNNYNNNHNYKRSWNSKINNKRPPMDNSLEILQGSADTIRKQ